MQLKFFELMKNGKDSNFEMMKDVFGIMSSSGLNSMKTAQEAANAIISITERMKDASGGGDDDKPSTLESIMKGLGSLAGPLIAPYANADAMARMGGGMPGMGGLPPGMDKILAGLMAGQVPQGARAPRPAPVAVPEPAHRPQVEAPEPGPSPAPKAPKMDGGAAMIAQFLTKFPEIKYAMLGNMDSKLGVDLFMPIILGVDQPALEALIANIPTTALMNAVKSACTPDEKKVIDSNKQWFEELKKAMIEEIQADAEDEDDEEGDEEEGDEVPPPAPKASVPSAPAASAPPVSEVAPKQ
jgi:hypothetical protein